MSNKSNASVQSMLVRWAELEPTRVEILTVSTARWLEDIGQFYIQVQPDDRRVLRVDEPFGFSTVATLCAVIEAAIVEREFRMMMMYGKSLETFEFTWTVLIGDGTSGPKQMKGRSSTKLEALLSAYVQALEAAK